MSNTSDEEVLIKLTAEQHRVLTYILIRAQEDPRFFEALAGTDQHVNIKFRNILNWMRQAVANPIRRTPAA